MNGSERCECGAVGVHPYPIGGGWALACDDCKASSLVGVDGADPMDMPFDPPTEADWERWRVDALGVASRARTSWWCALN